MKLICHFLLSITILVVGCAEFSSAQNKTNNPPNRKTTNKLKKQGRKPEVKFINPETLPKPSGYTHVVEAGKGRTIYISGQVALDRSGNVVGRGDFRAQTEQVFENIKAGLEAVGASFKDVVKINIYVTDISQLPVFREVRDKYTDKENPPASSMVEIRRLVREEFLVEIDATAVLPELK